MKSLVLAAGCALLAYSFQSGLPPQAESHIKTLQGAQALTVTYTLQVVGEGPKAMKATLSKPNLLRIEREDGYTLSDGKVITVYSKKDNTFTESPFSDAAFAQTLSGPEAWGWSAFFAKDAAKVFRSGQVGVNRVIKASPVSEISTTVTGRETPLTLYFDAKLGFARGFAGKFDEKEYLVVATEVKVGTEALSVTDFTFKAPEGAKKAEPAPAAAPTYASVQKLFNASCMPCHSGGRASAGIDLTTYDGIVGSVTPGNAMSSRIYRAISGNRPSMPKGRAPLKEAEVKAVEGWINDGAKKE